MYSKYVLKQYLYFVLRIFLKKLSFTSLYEEEGEYNIIIMSIDDVRITTTGDNGGCIIGVSRSSAVGVPCVDDGRNLHATTADA